MKKYVYFRLVLIAFFAIYISMSAGCGKSGALKDPVSHITPSIQNLQTKTNNIAKCTGGILAFTLDWTSPESVSTASAYLSFVQTISLPVTEPIGIIGSATDMITTSQSTKAVMSNQNYSFDFSKMPIRHAISNTTNNLGNTTVNDPQATADFYKKYASPIQIPVKINTDEKAGQFFAQIPFTKTDIASAPLGVHQMMVYMNINGYKTNTLSFELTFMP